MKVFIMKIFPHEKNKLPLLNNLITKNKWEIEQVFVISLDGAIIGSETELNKIL